MSGKMLIAIGVSGKIRSLPFLRTRMLPFLCLFCLSSIRYYPQSGYPLVPETVRLPKDSATRKLLMTSLNKFLVAAEAGSMANVFPGALPETSLLIDEIRDLPRHEKGIYKPQLISVIRQGDSTFMLRLAYMRSSDSLPDLKAMLTFLAIRREDGFSMSSPLKYYTASWQSASIGNARVYYKKEFDKAAAQNYFDLVSRFDKKLQLPPVQAEYYSCDDFHEALRISGVDYKKEYNGYRKNTLTSSANGMRVEVNGLFTPFFSDVDPHDLWHSRLHLAVAKNRINRPVDEGTAYLYGGSWGFTWEEILAKFKAYAAANPSADWLKEYYESKNFDEKGKYPLNADMAINALIVQKLEREKGMQAVLELVSCGPKEKNQENYFRALEKLTGITKKDFNRVVAELIKAP
jgi:hypothetical protein